MASTKQAALQSVQSLLQQITAASEKRAAAKSELEGRGATSHPIKDVDDGTQTASEGARSKENKEDVKEEQGAPGVESTEPGTPGGQDSVQMNIGTVQSATGEDPSVETESANHHRKDPGTTHPAKIDNNEIDGKKYAAHVLALTKKAADAGNVVLATLATEANGEIQKRAAAKAGKTVEPQQKEAQQAAQAGAELAAATVPSQTDKQAEAMQVVNAIDETVQTAFLMAEKTAAYLDAYFAKVAEDKDDKGGKDDKGNPSQGSADNASPPTDAASDDDNDAASEPDGDADDAGTSPDEQELLAALTGGGQNMGGGEAMADMAGVGPGAGAGADAGMAGAGPAGPAGPIGDPGAAAGAPAGMPGGGMPGGGNPEQEMQMLQAICQQLGISPEELLAGSVAKQAELLVKRANDKKAGDKKATWQPKTAEELRRYRATFDYVREITGR